MRRNINNRQFLHMMAMLAYSAGGMGLYPAFGVAERGNDWKSTIPVPPKPVYTKEQEAKLWELALDKSTHGRKAYKNYKDSISA